MSAALTTLICPKCTGEMRTYERSGVHVDQCRDCRGLFLDRGELERLMDLEAAFASRPAPAWTQPAGDDGERDRRASRPDPAPTAAPAAPHPAERRPERGEGLGDLAELGGVGGLGSLGSLADLGELFERDSGRRQTTDPRTGQTQPVRKRGGIFRELFEGLGD